MTIKNLAYRVQQRLSAATDGSLKRSHVYELLAAAFCHSSYAALCSDSVFTQLRPSARLLGPDTTALMKRCDDLGYGSSAEAIATALIGEVQAVRLAAVRIEDVVNALRASPEVSWGWDYGEDSSDAEGSVSPSVHDFIDLESGELSAFLVEGLESAANRSNASAHYALALLHTDDDENNSFKPQSSLYWHRQRLAGEPLSPAATEWADEHARQCGRATKATHHLREAARLGDSNALLDLAELNGDPAFFEVPLSQSFSQDPARVAQVAAKVGRNADEHRWLTVAAEAGDIDSMLALIESYDQDDLEHCWTWIHLARMLGTDFTRSDMRAYHDGGPQADQEYDDDYGGGAYVAGREAIEIEPLEAEADRIAKLRAEALYRALDVDRDEIARS